MSNNDKKEKEESKINEEPMEIKQEEVINKEEIIPQEEIIPENKPIIESDKIIPEVEESKINQEIPQNSEKNIKKEMSLKLTNDLVKKRYDYAKKISPITYMNKNNKKREFKMTEEEKEKNRKILYNMNLKLNFVKNPRYRNNIPPPRYTDTNYQPINSPDNAFSIEPQEVVFKDYQGGSIYQIDLKILNRTQLLTSFKYIPPMTENFTIKNVIYPKKDSSLIAPGMFAKMQILFYAKTMDNFEDEIIILTEKIAFKVPLKAIRDKPAIILKNPLDCGKCLVGDKIEKYFLCKNNGGDAHFKFYIEGQENPEEKNIQKVEENKEELMGALQNNSLSNELLVIPPFTVFPREFYLYKGMSQNISVSFCPIEEGVVEKKLILVCDTTRIQYTLKGEQIKVDIIIKTLDGLDMSKKYLEKGEEEKKENVEIVEKKEYIDDEEEEKKEKFQKLVLLNKISEKEEKLENLFFEDTFPFASRKRILVLKNISSLPIKYHWSIYDFYHQNEFNIIGDETFFTIEPEEGVFKANEEVTFTITFKPINSIIYEQKLELFIEEIPFQAIKQFNFEENKTMKTTISKVEPYLPLFNSSMPSYPLYTFSLRGRGKTPCLKVDKSIIDLGDIYVGQSINDSFVVTSEQSGYVTFRPVKIFQQILTKRNGDDNVDYFYKNPSIENSVIFKDKIMLNLNLEDEEPIQSLFAEKGAKTFLEHNEVNYIEITTNKKNFLEINNINQEEILNNKNNENNVNENNNGNNNDNNNKNNQNEEKNNILEKTKSKLKETASSKNSKNKTGFSNKTKTSKSKNTTSKLGINRKTKTNLDENTITEKDDDDEINEEQILKVNDKLKISLGEDVVFKIKFTADKIGKFKSSIVFQLDEGISFDIDILANIIGPDIAINTSLIDFGLFRTSTIQTKEFEIENVSPIKLQYLIKEARYKTINFENILTNNFIQEFEGVLDETKDIIYRDKVKSLIEYDNTNMKQLDIMKLDSYIMKFSSVFGELNPYEKKTIVVSFLSPYPKRIEDENNTIEVLVKNGKKNEYLNFKAQCEEADAYITETFIIPKVIFLTMPIQHNNNIITIINPSNLPVHFKWDNVFEVDKLSAEFEPNTGEIPPHGKVDINFKIVYFFLSSVDDMFICHIEELDIPLGVVVQGTVVGLDIGYEIFPESYEAIQTLNSSSSQLKKNKNNYENVKEHNLAKTGLRQNLKNSDIRNVELEKATAEKLKLKQINLKNLRVNTPFEMFIKLKNLSGIPTKFILGVKNYPPGKEKVIKIDKDQTTTNITKLSKLSKKTQKNKNFKIDHLLLSAAHEEINFTSPKGQEFTKQKQIEKDSILYLSSQKGIAIVIEPKKGDLPPHSETIIKLSFFNECVGDFHDILTSNIKGLDKTDFPINLRIKGNPLQLSPFQPGVNYLMDPPLLKMGYLLRNTGSISKNLKFVNIGQNTIGLDWKIYDYEDFLKPKDRPSFDLKIVQGMDKKYKINFNPIAPKEFPDEKKYFTIEPQSSVVGPKSTGDFTVTFKTDSEGMKEALFIAYPKINDDTQGNVKFDDLAVKVIASGLSPHLTVDRNTNFDGEYEYRFYIHSYGKHPKPYRPIILINKEKINFIVKLDIEGPFKIIKTDPIEATLSKGIYNIIPNSNLKIDVKYIIPNVNDEKEWPMTLTNIKRGKLIVTFENGEQEHYNLTAYLLRPRILMSLTGNQSVESLDYIDFGYVNCASMKIEPIYLMNDTTVDTNWVINYVKFVPRKTYGAGTVTIEEKEDMDMCDDSSVFDFDVSSGVIYGPTEVLFDLPVGPALPRVETIKSKKYKPLMIKVSFHPKKNIFYKCRYKIATSTGNSIDFILKGHGSYLEEDIIEYNKINLKNFKVDIDKFNFEK